MGWTPFPPPLQTRPWTSLQPASTTPVRLRERSDQAMKLGVFDHMDRGQPPLDQLFRERLRLVEAYDEAGFHGYHVAEHHATPLGVAPSPGVWMAAIAERTKRLR